MGAKEQDKHADEEHQPLLKPSKGAGCCSHQNKPSATVEEPAIDAAPVAQHMHSEGPSRSQGEPGDDRLCRICFDTEDPAQPDNPLISPCLCSGGSRFVHRKCLQQWRETSKDMGRERAFYRCEVCHFEYRFIRLDGARWLSHPVVVPSVFALILMILAWLSGYVPITEAVLFSDMKLEGAAKIACHLTDGLIILGLVGLTVRLYMFCNDVAPSHSSNCCNGCNGTECTGCAYCDCAAVDCAGPAAGELCGVMMVVVLVVAAVVGLVLILPIALGWMYELVDKWTASTVHMVENIDHHHKKQHQTDQAQASSCEHV